MLIISAFAATLSFCVKNTPPTSSTQSFEIQDQAPVKKITKKTSAVVHKIRFSEGDISLDNVDAENKRLIAQRDVRQLIYPIYNANKPFNAKTNDSCYVLIDKAKLSVDKCSNAVVKRVLSTSLSKYNNRFPAIFANNKLKFRILLTFE